MAARWRSVNAAARNHSPGRSTESITPITAESMGELGRPTAVMAEKPSLVNKDALADAGADCVQREYGIAAVGAVEIERLDDEDFAALVRGHFLRCHNIADDAADQHERQSRVDSRKLKAINFSD